MNELLDQYEIEESLAIEDYKNNWSHPFKPLCTQCELWHKSGNSGIGTSYCAWGCNGTVENTFEIN